MKKFLKFFVVLTVLLFGIVLAAVIYVATFDPNDHKAWIAEQFSQRTGRTLALNGAINLSLYPWLGVNIENVTLDNAPGFGQSPLFHADTLAFRVKLLSLLGDTYEIDTVKIHGARINLAINESGQRNWADPREDPEVDTDPAKQREANPFLSKLVVGGVDIRDARLSWDDRFAEVRYDIKDFNMSTDALVYGEPIPLNLTLTASATRPALSAQLDLTTTLSYDLDAQRYGIAPLQLNATVSGPNIPEGSGDIAVKTEVAINSKDGTLTIDTLQLDALDMRLTASVSGRDIQTKAPAYQGHLSLSGKDLALLFKVAEIEPLATQIAELDHQAFDLSAQFGVDMTQGSLQVPSLQMTLLGADISGNLAAAGIRTDKPQVRGALRASGPDLPTLMEVLGQLQGGDRSPLSHYGRRFGTEISNKAFDVATEFDTDLATGKVEVPLLKASILGFNLEGKLSARDLHQKDGAIKGSLRLSGGQLRELLSALEQPDLAEVAERLSLTADLSGTRDNLSINPLNLDLVLSGPRIPNSPVTLALDAASRIDLDADTLVLDSFSLSGLGLDASGNINVTHFRDAPQYQGQVNLARFNLRRLLTQLNQPAPNTADPKALESLSVATAFDGSATHINLSELGIGLDGSSLQGRMALSDFDNPALEFALNADRLNLERYLPPESTPTETDSTAQTGTEIPVDRLRALRLDGVVSADELTLSGMAFSNASLALNASAGKLAITSHSDLYTGRLEGDISLDVSGNTPLAGIDAKLTNINLEPLLRDLLDTSYLSGKGNVALDLSARGADSETMKHSLKGNGRIDLRDGVLRGVNVSAVLAQVEAMIRTRRPMNLQRGEETPFDSLSANLVVNEGVITSDDLNLAAPGFQVKGKGTLADLTDETLNFKLVTSVDQRTAITPEQEFDIGGYSLPITCNGALASPNCRPNAEAIIQNLMAGAVEKGFTNLLRRSLGGESQETQQQDTTNSLNNQEEKQPKEEQSQPDPINRALDKLFRNR